MSGPPPKPTKLRILQGNPAKRPLPKNEPQPKEDLGNRPSWLDAEAKREWKRIVTALGPAKVLTAADWSVLAATCQCWSLYVAAVNDIRENGYMFETGTGYQAQRPAVSIMVKMLEKLSVLWAKLGLSPADRVRLALPEQKQDDDFERFLKGATAS